MKVAREQAAEAFANAVSDAPGFVENLMNKYEHAVEEAGRDTDVFIHKLIGDYYPAAGARPGVELDTPEFKAKVLAGFEHSQEEDRERRHQDALDHPQHNDGFDASGNLLHFGDPNWNKIENNPLSIPAAITDLTPPTSVEPYDISAAHTDLRTPDGLDASGDALHFNSNSVATAHDPLSTPMNVTDPTPQVPAHVYEVPAIHTEHLAFHW
jgi:hypothetical protein